MCPDVDYIIPIETSSLSTLHVYLTQIDFARRFGTIELYLQGYSLLLVYSHHFRLYMYEIALQMMGDPLESDTLHRLCHGFRLT
jgi:hypothetical protein